MNSLWLVECISFPDIATMSIETISHPGSRKRTGRPQKDFESCSTKTKRLTIQHILETSSQEDISMNAEVQFLRKGKRDSAAIVKELCDFSPKRGTTIKKKRGRVFQAQSKIDQVLALTVDTNLLTHQYKVIRQQTNKMHKNMYPAYHKIKAAKQLCYPSDVNVTETFAEIKLQSLIDHTIMRLCKVQEDAF
ncbi:hypothetical protein AVEN_22709-1 [Araneus ventricosus]|uniref:Uncharacterized protein n=1 Tax=Araneus ventricosus TaxID=182803 RepID=A0A4Y2WNJ7_ARAVE|nr:hypothetical protein AVEN_193524-1 [Araneus ventricosus]GBO38288.1 hypothetical protein AVEN_22709-1 [Araneus ventricosus]